MKHISEKRILPPAFWALCGLEALAVLLALLSIPGDPKNAVVAGFSRQRLVMMAASLLLALVFAGLGWASVKYTAAFQRAWHKLSDRVLGWSAALMTAAAVTSLWLLLLPPPRIQGALLERIQPYLILLILVTAQAGLVTWRLERERLRRALGALRSDLTSEAFQRRAGWALLGLSALVGLATVFFTYYNLGDEGDTFATGWLMARGSVLYRDLFSHHFPLPYLWSGLVIAIFGPSVLAVRLSLVLLRAGMFAGAMKITRWHLPLGLAVFCWSLIGPLYLGNMALYDSFAALLLVPAAAVTLAFRLGPRVPDRAGLVFAGAAIALAVLADPLAAPVGVLLLGRLFLSDLRPWQPWRAALKTGFARLAVPLASMAAVGLLFALWLAVSGAVGAFFQQVFWFNQVVYNNYSSAPTLGSLFQGALSGLGIFNPSWRAYPGLYYQWPSYAELDGWLFAGFFFRLAVIGLSLRLLLRRAWLDAAFVYLTASMLLWRVSSGFHAQSFALFAVTCAALLACGVPAEGSTRSAPPARRTWTHVERALGLLIVLPVAGMFLWLNLRGVQFLIDHRAELPYSATFGSMEGNGGFYRSATCHLPDARVLIYPGRFWDYFAAQIPPAGRYAFMFPWVADVAQEEVIADLRAKKDQPILVAVDKDWVIWEHPVREYMQPMLRFLDEEYIPIQENVYVSPGLQQRCPQAEN